MAHGKIIYPSGESTQVTYQFIKNYNYEHDQGYVESDDHQRAFDGTLFGYTGARKKTFLLSFTNVLLAQLQAFQLAYVVGGKIDLYLDGDSPTPDATVKIMEPPLASSQAGFVGGEHTYSFDLNMEEV